MDSFCVVIFYPSSAAVEWASSNVLSSSGFPEAELRSLGFFFANKPGSEVTRWSSDQNPFPNPGSILEKLEQQQTGSPREIWVRKSLRSEWLSSRKDGRWEKKEEKNIFAANKLVKYKSPYFFYFGSIIRNQFAISDMRVSNFLYKQAQFCN